MTQFSTSIVINASQKATWKVLSDVPHWHKWTLAMAKGEAQPLKKKVKSG